MNSMNGNSFLFRGLMLAVCGVSLAMLAATASFSAEPAEEKLNPTNTLAVEWLPEAYPVVGAKAEDEASMRKYTEKLQGTDLDFDMVPIPGGKFKMGSPEDEDDRNDNEGPQVEVCIEPFWMGTHEVSWDEYDTFSFKLDIQRRKIKRQEATKWDHIADVVVRPTAPYSDMTFEMGHDGYPAICMTQIAAKMYCKWLCAKTGRYYRLPTEAEWEYACRAGTTTTYSFGDDPDDLDDYACYFDNCPDGYDKIGQKKPNPWGLYDMHGNVAEWVLDQLVDNYYQQLGDGTAKGPFAVPTKLYPRVARGGHWDADPQDLRSAARLGSDPDWKMQDPQIPQSIWYHTDSTFVGFRVVRPLRMPTAKEAKLYEPDPAILKEYREAQGGKE